MTEPTDAAIDTLILEHGVMAQAWPTQRQLHAFARAVLAKWGQPAGASKPYGYVYAMQVAPVVGDERKVVRTVFTQKKPPCDSLPLYTTPQPAQPQAGAVPLTDEQRNAIYDKHCFLGDNGWEINWWQVIDEVEAAHGIGIKGGQHG